MFKSTTFAALVWQTVLTCSRSIRVVLNKLGQWSFSLDIRNISGVSGALIKKWNGGSTKVKGCLIWAKNMSEFKAKIGRDCWRLFRWR